jgi:hypothetical protein
VPNNSGLHPVIKTKRIEKTLIMNNRYNQRRTFHDKNINLLGKEPLLHRAIGVVYKPETERYSYYKNPTEELPETFPFGI